MKLLKNNQLRYYHKTSLVYTINVSYQVYEFFYSIYD